MRKFFCHENNCGKSFSNPYNLKRHHVLKHLRTRVFKCNTCGKCLSSAQNLREHEGKHNDQMLYYCPICDLHFRYCSQLSNHRKIHSVQMPPMQEFELTDMIKRMSENDKKQLFGLEMPIVLPPITREFQVTTLPFPFN